MKMLTRIALQRGWRSVLISDGGAAGKATFEFKGFGGSWLVVFNGRCGVLLDPGMARMWRRGGAKRFDSPDGRSLAVIVPCAGCGLRGRVLSLVSMYGPVSGAGFDNDSLSVILGSLPLRSVWVIDHLLCRARDHRFLGATKVLFERKPLGHHGRPTRIITRLRLRDGYTVHLHEVRVSCGDPTGLFKGVWGGSSGCNRRPNRFKIKQGRAQVWLRIGFGPMFLLSLQ